MAHQSWMWTTLPNGYTDGGRSLRVSVMLSPRLDAGSDPEKLSSFFPEWRDWPATLARASFAIHYGAETVEVRATPAEDPSRLDTTLGSPDSEAWKAIFHGGLFVHGFQFRDLSSHRVLSYDTTAVDGLVRRLYSELARTAAAGLPRVTDLLDHPDWQKLVAAVAGIDQRYSDRKTGLRTPERQFRDFVHGELRLEDPEMTALAHLQLFHTPLSTPKPVKHRRPEDRRVSARWLEYERRPLPSAEKLGERIDFHQVIAAMNQYPALLRRLGLVVDFVLRRDAFTPAMDAPLWTEVDLPAEALGVPRSRDVSPVTHARLTDRAFQAVSNPAAPAGEARVVDGLLDLDPKRFTLLQSDVDGAGLKLTGFARSLARAAPGEERVDPVTRQERELGAPALRTAGLMLVQRQRGAGLEQRFADNAARDQRFEKVARDQPGATPPELWAEDLVRGFRFDAWDATTGVWRSLCRRRASYELAGGEVVVRIADEEGTVRLAATQSPDPASNPDLVCLHEALVSWAGWSLAAPPPGRAIRPDDSVDLDTPETEAELPPGVRVQTRFQVLPGSLPRLRFGRRYWLRGRAVDLAGNSLPPAEGDLGAEQPERHAQPFLRYEPIAPPALALVRPEAGDTERPAEGESMERIAIRSFNDMPADNAVATGQEARRFAVPPQVSVRDAEQHGALDSGGRLDATTFDLLANRKDRDAHDPEAALQEELIPTQGPLDPIPVETVYAVYRDGHDLTYLPDPLAEEVAVRVLGHPNVDPGEVLTVPLYPEGGWPDARPFKVRVFEDPQAAPSYDPASHTLLVPLPKAVRAQVRLSVKPSGQALAELGVWSWLSAADRLALERTARDGQHWMLTPWRTVEVVHATQRPLIAPEIVEHVIWRPRGATHAVPRFVATCSLKSTARLDLLAEWHEPSDDPGAAESESVAADRPRGDTAFSVKITEPGTYASRLDGHERGGIPEHTVAGDDLVGVGLPPHDLVEAKHHELHDTRYRRIEYRLEATTRFREFLPPALLTETVVDEAGERAVPTDEHIKVVGPRLATWIPSSAPPPVPEILYVVPTFGWVRTAGPEGNATSWRRGGGLRVYFDRPWMVSGYGEMLAVVLPPAAFGGDPESQPAGAPYKSYVTQWGNDPIWRSPGVPGIAPRRGDFPLARTAPDPDGGWLPKNAPPEESDQPPGGFRVTGLVPPSTAFSTVEIAPHDVFYDEERRLWYCDLEIRQGASYWPFVRLALARYQPVSLDGAHLSEVVLADFMPLTADRWLHVNQTNDPRRRRVAVYGPSYTDSSGRREAGEAPSRSLFNALTGEVTLQEPAKISGRSVIEVWVERLDETMGEDFGWQRVPGAEVEPDATTTPGASSGSLGGSSLSAAVLARFVPGDLVARSVELHATRSFEAIARERLVAGPRVVEPLWSGQVSLASAALEGEDRHRLVIAEYEEYLIDDERPYDDIPERKGRRLVFFEHVELA